MRFAASPLMVAVALGLLGPSVLEAEDEGLEEHAPPVDEAVVDVVAVEVVDAG